MYSRTQIPYSIEVLHSQAESALQTIQKKCIDQNSDVTLKSYYVELQNIYNNATKNNAKKRRITDILTARNNLLEKSQGCRIQWNLLKQFIIQTYPPHIHLIVLKLIGDENKPLNVVNDWDEFKKMIISGWSFIKEHEKEVSKSLILPKDFVNDYKATYLTFLKALKTYQAKTIENRNVFTEHKMHNRKLYEALEKIMNGTELR
jgi:hypothetical protein